MRWNIERDKGFMYNFWLFKERIQLAISERWYVFRHRNEGT